MSEAEIVRDRSPSTPADLAFELAISWRDYRMAQHHFQQIALGRLESGRSERLGLENEIGEALSLQREATANHIKAFEELTPYQRKEIDPERRLECLHISLLWEREKELAALRRASERDRDQ